MTDKTKPRLRFFEESPGQRHIQPGDQFIYSQATPAHKINVIGTGTIGIEHMRVAAMLGRVSVHGIYDSQRESMAVATEEFARHSSEPLHHYDSLEAACNDDAVDALFICTPNYTHIDVFETAVKSGKPIFLEKPMATTLADAKRICEVAESYSSFIQVGLQYRYKAPYVEARHEALQRGTLGKIRMLSMAEYRPPFLDKVGQWNKFNAKSGGTLVEKCCHYFDLLTLFAQSRPSRVYASSGRAVNFTSFEYDGAESDIDDHGFVVIDYENGIRASFTLNMFCPQFCEELVVCGDEGRLVAREHFDFHREDMARSEVAVELGEMGASRRTDLGYTKPVDQSGHHGATWFEHVAFADQLDGKPVDAATPAEGLLSIVIASAAQQSASTGQPVDVSALIKEHGLDAVLNA